MKIDAVRVLRHLFTERSYERYYSPAGWDDMWTAGYTLDGLNEDGRYGALITLMCRHAEGGPILDAGCGDGLLEAKFRAVSPAHAVGIDYSHEAVAHAKARNILDCTFVQADYRDFRPEERFRLIVLNESLYYVADAPGVMTSLTRWLTPNGVFIVSMFDSRVTRRIWRMLARGYVSVQGVEIRDERTHLKWRIRVLRTR
jgi:trans-aconitate methyltransferase